ncbi:unnamed protein product [Caenorhabditis angaria]|uniref:Uncharacterized protein n=1 Tax=Caenorhabditis angaria TaxID=860376 RepID=A0A9P1IIF5_9PELO|nr:unnamed protein product [Caenorhabditis angaria]
MKAFFAILLLFAVSVNCRRYEELLGPCKYSEEGQTLAHFKKYYWGICHNGLIYKCGNAPDEPKEIRPFCLGHRRPSSPAKY